MAVPAVALAKAQMILVRDILIIGNGLVAHCSIWLARMVLSTIETQTGCVANFSDMVTIMDNEMPPMRKVWICL
jgi:hypothetical protein